VLSLPEAVRKLTSEPADLFGIQGRGRIAPGAWADLLLFDPATVNRGPKQRVFDLPGGSARLTTPAIGVQGVWVNGVKVAGPEGLEPAMRAAGKAAVEQPAGSGRAPGPGKLPGRLLREFAA